MKYKGILSSHLLSPLSKITNPDQTSQFEILMNPNSNRVSDLLLNKTKLVTLHKCKSRRQQLKILQKKFSKINIV